MEIPSRLDLNAYPAIDLLFQILSEIQENRKRYKAKKTTFKMFPLEMEKLGDHCIKIQRREKYSKIEILVEDHIVRMPIYLKDVEDTSMIYETIKRAGCNAMEVCLHLVNQNLLALPKLPKLSRARDRRSKMSPIFLEKESRMTKEEKSIERMKRYLRIFEMDSDIDVAKVVITEEKRDGEEAGERDGELECTNDAEADQISVAVNQMIAEERLKSIITRRYSYGNWIIEEQHPFVTLTFNDSNKSYYYYKDDEVVLMVDPDIDSMTLEVPINEKTANSIYLSLCSYEIKRDRYRLKDIHKISSSRLVETLHEKYNIDLDLASLLNGEKEEICYLFSLKGDAFNRFVTDELNYCVENSVSFNRDDKSSCGNTGITLTYSGIKIQLATSADATLYVNMEGKRLYCGTGCLYPATWNSLVKERLGISADGINRDELGARIEAEVKMLLVRYGDDVFNWSQLTAMRLSTCGFCYFANDTVKIEVEIMLTGLIIEYEDQQRWVRIIECGNSTSVSKGKREKHQDEDGPEIAINKTETVVHHIKDGLESTKAEIGSNNQLSLAINDRKVITPIYGYKAVKDAKGNKTLLEIKLLEDSKVASCVTERTKFRTDKALATKLWTLGAVQGEVKLIPTMEVIAFSCVHTTKLITYTVGELISAEDFDSDLSKVCVPGIHFCLNTKDALRFHDIKEVSRVELMDFKEHLTPMIDENGDHARAEEDAEDVNINFEDYLNSKIDEPGNHASDEERLERFNRDHYYFLSRTQYEHQDALLTNRRSQIPSIEVTVQEGKMSGEGVDPTKQHQD
jgi:hypothetical protein